MDYRIILNWNLSGPEIRYYVILGPLLVSFLGIQVIVLLN